VWIQEPGRNKFREKQNEAFQPYGRYLTELTKSLVSICMLGEIVTGRPRFSLVGCIRRHGCL